MPFERQRMDILMAACCDITPAVHLMPSRLHLRSKVYFLWMQCMLYSRPADHKQPVLIILMTAQQCPLNQRCDVHIRQMFSLISVMYAAGRPVPCDLGLDKAASQVATSVH